MDPLEKNGQRYLRCWGTWQWQKNQRHLTSLPTPTFFEMISTGCTKDQPVTDVYESLSMHELKQVDSILKTFAEVRFRIIEAYYAKGLSEEMIAESLQNPTSPSTVSRWLTSSNHMVGSAMISQKPELC